MYPSNLPVRNYFSSICQPFWTFAILQLHAEAGKGQFELVLGHTVCTHSADNLVYAREVIKAVARKHGLLATFLPKYALSFLINDG